MTKKDEQIIKNAEEQKIPIFTLVAKDSCTVDTLYDYFNHCQNAGCSQEHLKGIDKRIQEFEQWQELHPLKVKEPD